MYFKNPRINYVLTEPHFTNKETEFCILHNHVDWTDVLPSLYHYHIDFRIKLGSSFSIESHDAIAENNSILKMHLSLTSPLLESTDSASGYEIFVE